LTNVADAEGVDLHSCREGLLVVQKMHVPKVLLETDITVVVSKLLQVEMDSFVLWSIS
jgi:hypothetical protein